MHLIKQWAVLAVLGVAAVQALAQHENQPNKNPNPTTPNQPNQQNLNQPNAQNMPSQQMVGQAMSINVDQAKEMAALIQQGQMNLRDATAMAEKHSNGTALEAVARIEPTMGPTGAYNKLGEYTKPGETNKPGEAGKGTEAAKPGGTFTESTSGKHLVYEVSCLVKDKLQTLRVDGLTKQVLEGAQASTERPQAHSVRPPYMP